jgi:4-hydroxy 2-oxovalerate aldolase
VTERAGETVAQGGQAAARTSSRRVRVIDSTLRDGSHAKAHQFTADQVGRIAGGLDAAGLDTVEVSHGDGLGGSSLQYGRSLEPQGKLLAAASAAMPNAKLAILLLPGIGTVSDLEEAAGQGASVARIATHVTEADICEQHIRWARDHGMEAIGFLMMAHMAEPPTLVEQARKMADYGAQCVYVVDSAGALTPDGVRERVGALRDALPAEVEIGIHAHNNLGAAIGNSLAAITEGAGCVDGCACGLGAGAGNTQTEVLVAALDKLDVETGVDVFKVMDVAEELVRPIMDRPQVIDRAGLVLGYAGVYSSFLLHAERAAERFGVSVREILLECGRLRTVGGQEDMIVDIAADLARRR